MRPNTLGTATGLARADHIHNTVLVNSSANSVVTANTVSLTDVLLTDLSLTPVAGTYLVQAEGVTYNNGPNNINFFTVYVNGVAVPSTTRSYNMKSSGDQTSFILQHVTTVNGSQPIDVRWRVSGGTGSVDGRSLILIRIG